jgi:hypothetical protein
MGRRLAGLFFLALLSITGCQTARFVSSDAHGGVIAIPNNSDFCRKQAEELMAQKCPQGYVIDREEEVVVGQVTTANRTADTDQVSRNIGKKKNVEVSNQITRTSYTETTQDKTEYRIYFHGK